MIYFALDVETANSDYSSICQIGIAKFEGEKIIDTWDVLINPKTYFDPMNVSIHGIKKSDVKNAPTFKKFYPSLKEIIENQYVVHHMPFDKVAIHRACESKNLSDIDVKWIDSAKLTRRVWEQFSSRGYGLKNISNFLGIEFKHHDALEDAIAAGKVAYHAVQKSNIPLDEWYFDINARSRNKRNERNKYWSDSYESHEGNPDGVLFGETVVFTGALQIPRNKAAKIAAEYGCNVKTTISKKVTMLVVGRQDLNRLNGYSKSSKERKAEELIKKGAEIRIISEEDFYALL
jgi:DNA polymerase-3 subunit epsilon